MRLIPEGGRELVYIQSVLGVGHLLGHRAERAGSVQIVDQVERTGTRPHPHINRTVFIDTENGVPFQEGEIGTLKLIANAGNIVNVDSIANSLGIYRQVAQHYLDNLKEKEYVVYFIEGYGGESSGYRLTPKGREYVVRSGII